MIPFSPDLRRAESACWCHVDDLIVARATTAPTIRLRGKSWKPGEHTLLTPYQLLWKYGIHPEREAGPYGIDMHWSVYSYLWAQQYYGFDVYVESWPKPLKGNKGLHGWYWQSKYYRPIYAFVALLENRHPQETLKFRLSMFALSPHKRVKALTSTANFYLANPVDTMAPGGFHDRVANYGIQLVMQ